MSILTKVPTIVHSSRKNPPVYLNKSGEVFSHKPSDNTNFEDWSVTNLLKLNALQSDVSFSKQNDINSLDSDIALAESVSNNLK